MAVFQSAGSNAREVIINAKKVLEEFENRGDDYDKDYYRYVAEAIEGKFNIEI